MTRRRATRYTALTLVVVAATGLAAARADELSDLRANSKLLEQKLVQAQALNPDDTGTPPKDATPASSRGNFPGSFLIPGTRTSVRIGGNLTTIGTYSIQQ